MLGNGDRAPAVQLWTAPSERATVQELVRDKPGLFLFYLFDWSST